MASSSIQKESLQLDLIQSPLRKCPRSKQRVGFHWKRFDLNWIQWPPGGEWSETQAQHHHRGAPIAFDESDKKLTV